ncbi:MAG TPA: rubrerythrin family protein [Thermoanaerobaculia bacterium]
MRKVIFISVCLALIAAPIVAAVERPVAPDVRVILEKSLANEREAIVRYTAYAAKADAEGYPGAAALFRAQAQAEHIHSHRFAQALKERGIVVPPEPAAYKPLVGSTADNLRAAASAENAERDGIYRDAIDTARRNGDTEIAKIFDETRDTEVEHANLCTAAARNIESMKQPKTFYVCPRCGYTTDVKLPLCPDCMHKDAMDPVN